MGKWHPARIRFSRGPPYSIYWPPRVMDSWCN
ncbi:uncharacterized protein G2W53_006019 [Senna tora]|uniref:Uncharacterized protein n=1 Tax=Senna tora TaxID=362788 RepID=A0A834X4K4_9FABA|nr:uncharacterized protein G2W53_006019 [Senna tora]